MHTLADAFHNYVDAAHHLPALKTASKDLSRAELRARVAGWSNALTYAGARPRDRIVLLAASSVDFVSAFWAVQLLGATAVPVPGFERRRSSESRREALLKLCGVATPRLIVCAESDIASLAGVSSLPPLLTSADISEDDSMELPEAPLEEKDIAVIQFTSGSTQTPRGCALSHRAILANAIEVRNRTGAEPRDIAVCWLPLHHDMGLMGGVVAPVISNASTHLLTAAAFLANPLSWLRAMAAERPTHCAVPNFALSLAVERLERRGPIDVDLSQVKTIMCGAELINADTVRRFFELLAPCGLRPTTFHAAYGMAETTVMAASLSGGLRVDTIDAKELGSNLAIARANGSQRSIEVVSVGQTVAGGALRIVDNSGHDLPERHLGRIVLKSPSLMRDYFNNPGASGEVLDGDWLQTGDLGYRANNDLYVVGRADDVIVMGGQNVHPSDVEDYISRELSLDPLRLVAERRSGALGTNEIVIVHETRNVQSVEALKSNIAQACYAACGFFPKAVILEEPGFIPRTTSGKVQRAALRSWLSAQDRAVS